MSSQSLMDLIHKAGFKGNAANIMYAIVMAESGGNARAFNGNAGTGDQSYGLAQINMIGSMGPERLREFGLKSYEDLYDPLTNLRVAYQMSGGGTHFGDWSTYNRGDYKQFLNGDTSALVSNSSGGGGGAMTSSVTPTKLTPDQYKAALGELSGIIQSVPELSHLLQEANAQQWTADTFLQKVHTSQWWRTHNDAARRLVALKISDPQQYITERKNAIAQIGQLASQLGFTLNANQMNNLASRFMAEGWTSQTLQANVMGTQSYNGLKSTDNLKGQMAQTVQQLQQLGEQYGQQWSPATLAYRAQQVLEGKQTIDTYTELMRHQAKSMFPGLSTQIDSGMTVKDMAAPYVQSMSNLLEVDPAKITTYDPTIRRALQGTQGVSADKGSAPTSMPLWQFEQQLRQDPRWQYTRNAKDTVSSALVQLGRDFGFGPQG